MYHVGSRRCKAPAAGWRRKECAASPADSSGAADARYVRRCLMRKKPYPLEALRTVRSHALQDAQLGLQGARAARQDAQARLAEVRRAQAALLAERVRTSGADGPSTLCGAELARSGNYALRLQLAYASSREQVRNAEGAVRRCERALRLAELTLHQAYVEHELVERHHATFAQEVRKKAERELEDEQDDWQAFMHSRGRVKPRPAKP